MKRILTLITIAVIGSAIFTGCWKYDFSPTMSANIGTLGFNASGKKSVYGIIDTSTHNPQLVTVYGNTTIFTPGTPYAPSIVILVPNAIGVYTIDTNNASRSATIYLQGPGTAGSVAVSGNITVIGLSNGKITGKFTLTCKDGTSVTNGNFIATE